MASDICVMIIRAEIRSSVTESLFGGGGQRGEPDLRLGGGGQEDGIAMRFFPITFIVHNQKSNGGGGGAWCEWGPNPPPPPNHSYATGNSLPLLFPIIRKRYLYAPFHRQDAIYPGPCYTSYGALAGTKIAYMHHPDTTVHTTGFVMPVVEHWLDGEIA